MVLLLWLSRAPSLLAAPFVPGMRIARHLDAEGVNRGVGAAEQSAQIRSAKGEIDRLLRPADDPDAPAVRFHDPDAAGSGAIDPADAVYLEPVRNTRLAVFVEVGEDAAPDHVAVRVEPDRVDILRR